MIVAGDEHRHIVDRPGISGFLGGLRKIASGVRVFARGRAENGAMLLDLDRAISADGFFSDALKLMR